MPTFLPFESGDYDNVDPLASMDEEQRRRFLESAMANVTPTNVPMAPRGFEALAPTAVGTPPAATEAEGTATRPLNAQEEEADLMRRFVAAQQQGSRRDSVNAWASGVGQDVANFVNGGSYGRGVYRNSIERDTSLRGQPVEDLKAQEAAKANAEAMRRKTASDARDAEADAARVGKLKTDTANAQAEAARDAALAQMDSTETQALRDYAKAQLASRGPEVLASLDRMSGIQIRDVLRSGTSTVNAEIMADLQRNRMSMQDENADAARALQAYALKQNWDLANLTLAQREHLARMEADFKTNAAERERRDKLSEREVGGYEFADPQSPPSTDSAKKMGDAAISRDKIQASIRRLKELYKRYGTELFGAEAGLMESEFMDITNGLRTFNDMGVPNGRDYEMLAKEISDPTTWRDLFTSSDRNLSKLDALSARLDEKLDDTAFRLKFKPKMEAPQRPTPEPAKLAPRGGATKASTAPPSGQAPASRPLLGEETRIPGSGTMDDPLVLRIKGKKPGYIRSILEEGQVARIKESGQMFMMSKGQLLPIKVKE